VAAAVVLLPDVGRQDVVKGSHGPSLRARDLRTAICSALSLEASQSF
jgi:hypothetical protein